jgi:hypothetical protein
MASGTASSQAPLRQARRPTQIRAPAERGQEHHRQHHEQQRKHKQAAVGE